MASLDPAFRYRWGIVGLWLLANQSGFMVIYTVGIVLPAISLDLGLSPGQQGVVGSISQWGSIGLAIPIGWWVSRFGPKAITTVTLTLISLFLLVQGLAPVFTILLIGRFMFGLVLTAQQPVRALLFQQWFKPNEIVLVNGAGNVLFGLIVGGGLLGAPFLLAVFSGSWRSVFYTFAGYYAVMTVLWIIFGRERKTADYRRREVTREVGVIRGALSYKNLWIGGLGFLGAEFSFGAFVSFYPTLMLDTYGLSLRWSGAILAMGVLVGGVAGLVLSYMAAARNKEKTVLQVLGILMVGTYLGMIMTGSLASLLFISFFNGVSWGFFPILLTVPFHLPGIRPRETAVAISFTMMMIGTGAALGPLVVGFLQEATGDLKDALFLVSFASLSLVIAGITLRPHSTTAPLISI